MSNIVYQIRSRKTGKWYESHLHFDTKDQSRSPIYVSEKNAEKKKKELEKLIAKHSSPSPLQDLEVIKIKLVEEINE